MNQEIEGKLRPILIQLMGCCDGIPDEDEVEAIKEAMSDIQELVVSTVPRELSENTWRDSYIDGNNYCRTEILKKWS